MKDAWSWLFVLYFLAGCGLLPSQSSAPPVQCVAPPSRQDLWADYMTGVDRMSPEQVRETRKTLQDDYHGQPDDLVRLQLAYVMIRGEPSLPQLQQVHRILQEMDSAGQYAAFRDLLDRQALLAMQLQESEGEILQLKAQLDQLKKIETDLSEPPDEKRDHQR